jgi:antitoxin VapB
MPGVDMTAERHVKLFRNGRNKAIRIPREFEFPGDEAIIRQEGDRLVIEPMRRKSLLELLNSWEPLDEEPFEIEELPIEPVDI